MTLYRKLLELSDPDQERVMEHLRGAVYDMRRAWDGVEEAAAVARFDIRAGDIEDAADCLRNASDAAVLTVESFRSPARWPQRCGVALGVAVVLGCLLLALAVPSDDIPTADIYQEASR